MIEIKLDPLKWEELHKKGYSLDMIFLLKMVEGEYDTIYTHPKLMAIQGTVERKGLVCETGLTEEGKALLAFLSSSGEMPKRIRKKKEIVPAIEDAFTRWWKAYPATNTFEYKGRKFKGDRALKVKKNDCKVKLEKILAEKEYTIEELILALKLEISQKAESSVKTNTNKMSYFQNSLTYLNQCTYEPFIELVRAGHKPEEDTKTLSTNETFI